MNEFKEMFMRFLATFTTNELSVDDVQAEFKEKITKLEDIKQREESKILEADIVIREAEEIKKVSMNEAIRANKFAAKIEDFCNF